MATPVIMPRQGQSVESCIITEWHKQKGDQVEVGDILFSYETDKASFEEEAKEAGVLLEVFFAEEEDVPVLTAVAVIGQAGEDVADLRPNSSSDTPAEDVKMDSTPDSGTSQTQQDAPLVEDSVTQLTTGDQKISPRARNLAKRRNVDTRLATATGPEGRVIQRDIEKLIATGHQATPAAKEGYLQAGQELTGTGLGGRVTTLDLQQSPVTTPSGDNQLIDNAYQDVKLSNMRKVIAKAMHQSISTTAQLTLHNSFDATAILAYRKQLKASQEAMGLANITLNDIILYAVSRTLLNHPDLNAHFLGDSMRLFRHAHLGIAVDTERGLMVPTVFNADLKSLNQISSEVKELATSCQKGAVDPDSLQGATFTITNLGTLGIESFTPVLNPPQTGILGVNTIEYKAREVDGEILHYPAMGLSLTFDHRALDGAPAARFLAELGRNLESFSVLLSR